MEDLCLGANGQDGDVENPLPCWGVQSMVSMVPFQLFLGKSETVTGSKDSFFVARLV